jgi:hypothetical protein
MKKTLSLWFLGIFQVDKISSFPVGLNYNSYIQNSKYKLKFWNSYNKTSVIYAINMACFSFSTRFVPLSDQNRKLVEAIKQGK